jgi:outer membrane lipoprotein-sorting protein
MRPIQARASLMVLCIILLCAADRVVAEGSEPADAWHWLQSVRDGLSTTPSSAAFIQTFRPAGFDSGDRESGSLYISLPACVRWDYKVPLAKSFLLCGDTVYMWNVGESTGRKHEIRVAEQPGLDLMTLQVDLLRNRYDAVVTTSGPERVELTLSPKALDTELASATMVIEPVTERPIAIEYLDRQGNLTRFELTDYLPVGESNRFEPPPDIEWLDN